MKKKSKPKNNTTTPVQPTPQFQHGDHVQHRVTKERGRFEAYHDGFARTEAWVRFNCPSGRGLVVSVAPEYLELVEVDF